MFTIHSTDISSHDLQFGDIHVFKNDIRFNFHVIWLICIWVIWKECNSRFFFSFRNKQTSQDQLFDHINLHYWWWLKTYKSCYFYDLHSWWSDPSFWTIYYVYWYIVSITLIVLYMFLYFKIFFKKKMFLYNNYCAFGFLKK